MLAGSVCTFQTIDLTHIRELQTQATVIYMLFFLLVVDFKVHCRGALMEDEAVPIVAVTLNSRNTLKSGGLLCIIILVLQ